MPVSAEDDIGRNKTALFAIWCSFAATPPIPIASFMMASEFYHH
jgi:hypothetical protein